MSESKTTASGGGVGFLGLLCLLFIGLKLGNVIDWSWWWVMSPLWIPFAIFAVVFAVVCVAVGILYTIDHWKTKRRQRATIEGAKKAIAKAIKKHAGA